ncbi:PXA domain-containing protein [Fomitopsis serialis]|uniref:PXA domain-containing protein n=1 Tax=Fomitopsis serialis TaxID=139415 RepID=UPI0020086C6A|nr:PXA domain-containing protein [Neoantrodia serialis]KAH9937499.1 PXA domain-containing protein [Neoantrodia serialis]
MSTGLAPSLRHSVRSVKSGSSSLGDKPATKPAPKPVSLPRRLLFPTLPADADLPPLLTSPLAVPVLNGELYDFVALALRAYVNPWWTKITRYDKEFLPEITRILTSVVRTLEARLLATDLSPLVFRDLPTLLTQHYVDFRSARAKLHTSYATGGAATLPQLFHHLQPHMAISADGRVDDVYVRQAVDHILKACLPPEDYDSEAERYIVREIILSVLLKSVMPRVTQPWFIHKILLDQLGAEQDKGKGVEPPRPGHPTSTSDGAHASRQGFSLQSLAIVFLSAIQSISGVCLLLIHTYRQARNTVKRVNESAPLFPDSPTSRPLTPDVIPSPVPSPNPIAIPGSLAAVSAPLRVVSQPVTPPRGPPTPTSISSVNPLLRTTSASTVQTASNSSSSTPAALHSTPPSAPPSPPNYTAPSLHLVQTLLPPSLTARALTQTLALPLTALDPFLSRLLPYLLYTHALSPDRIAGVVRSAKRALFPEGWPAPPPPDPTLEEQAVMRAALGRRLLAAIPAPLAIVLGPTSEARTSAIDGILDPLSSQACNAHLMLFILDLVLVTVFPELGASEAVSPGAAAEGAISLAARTP